MLALLSFSLYTPSPTVALPAKNPISKLPQQPQASSARFALCLAPSGSEPQNVAPSICCDVFLDEALARISRCFVQCLLSRSTTAESTKTSTIKVEQRISAEYQRKNSNSKGTRDKQRLLVIDFTIDRDGNVSDPVIVKGSGDEIFDNCGLSALTKCELSPAPTQVVFERLRLRVTLCEPSQPYIVHVSKIPRASLNQVQRGITELLEKELTDPFAVASNSVDSELFDRFFYFVDAKFADTHMGLIDPERGAKAKYWTASEKKIIRDGLSTIFRRAPGLIVGAASRSRIALIRVGYDRSAYHLGPKVLAGDKTCVPLAAAGCGDIEFGDDFFASRDGTTACLIHELVHLSDAGARISSSPAFVSQVRPALMKVRRALQRHNWRGHTRLSDSDWLKFDSLAALEGLPYLYSCTNEQEALADLVTYHLSDDTRLAISRELESTTLELVLNPKPADLEWRALYVRGRRALREKKWQLAKQIFEQAVSTGPTALEVYCHLVDVSVEQGDVQSAVNYAQIANHAAMHNKLSFQPYDENQIWQIRVRAMLVAGEYAKGLAVTTLWISRPGASFPDVMFARSRCLEKLRKFGRAAATYHSSYYNDSLSSAGSSVFSKKDPRQITSSRGTGIRLRKAYQLEVAADHQRNIVHAEQLRSAAADQYVLALTDKTLDEKSRKYLLGHLVMLQNQSKQSSRMALFCSQLEHLPLTHAERADVLRFKLAAAERSKTPFNCQEVFDDYKKFEDAAHGYVSR